MGSDFNLEDTLIVLQRRFLFFLIPVIVLAPLGILVVMLLPPKYTAQGTILVESQQIPEDWAPTTIIADAQERIQTIRQRVITRNRLLEVSDKFDLFPRELGFSESERVNLMRERLVVRPITTRINRKGRSRDGTIAFKVSYVDRSAENAYAVANEFMSLFLSEDVSTRKSAASNTTEFFRTETQRLSGEVDELELKIATFKVENSKSLPEHLNMHLDMLERSTRDLSTNQSSIIGLEEELRFLESQLTSVLSGVGGQEGPAQELTRLRAELTKLRATFTDANPSVKAIKDQIRAVERQLAPSRAITRLSKKLEEGRASLKEAEQADPRDEELVATLRDTVTKSSSDLSDQFAKEAQSSRGTVVSAQLQSRITQTRNRIDMLHSQSLEIKAQIEDLQTRIGQTPDVERRLSSLTRNYNILYKEYQDILSRQQSAELAENLEDNQKAEKFRVLEAAVRPEKPSSPERSKLSILAIFAALGIGSGAAIAAELMFATIRGRNHLSNLIEDHPIAVIPYIKRNDTKRVSKTPKNKKNGRKSKSAIAASLSIFAITTSAMLPSTGNIFSGNEQHTDFA